MNRPRPAANLPDPTIRMAEGWHCLHQYFKVDQAALMNLTDHARGEGRDYVCQLLNSTSAAAPIRLQTSIVSGDRADLCVMMMDPDPLKIDAVVQEIRNSAIGAALKACYSFVSITEVSEYVPSIEQYSDRLRREGTDPSDPAFEAKVNAYRNRLPKMNQQRMYPDIPDFPVIAFYPMNKARHPIANWYMEPFSERARLMAEHATSGIAFAGRVSQLITASTGFDDWEWGVTLWSRAPEYIKEIVYGMRFDQASAKYAEFGPFYVSYAASPEDAMAHMRI